MFDQRLITLAKILVTQSLEIKPREKIILKLSGVAGLPLARVCYQEIILAGGIPYFQLQDDWMEEFFFSHAKTKQIEATPTFAMTQANYFDKNLTIVAEDNVNNLGNISSDFLLTRARLNQPVKDIIMSKPWVLTYYPTAALAQAAHMSLRELEDYIFGSTDQNWPEMSKLMHRLARKLDQKDLKIIGKKTNLTLSTKNRSWITDDWKSNMPGGEIFTSPIIDSVNGYIYFDFPLSRDGKTMSDIFLEFTNGQVVTATSSSNQEFLHQLLATDPAAKFVGEIAIGLNPGCTKYLDNILYDEKMVGTIHLALGAGFPECGQPVSQSALHLDIVKNMKLPGSQLWAGDDLILATGVLCN